MTKDDLIRAYNNNSASWPAIVGLYSVLVGALIATANAII